MTLAVRAMRLADGKDPLLWDTLAAAYAETGRFTDAVLTARRALALSEPGGEQVEAIKGRIALYESGKPYRETSVSGALGRPGSIQVIRTSLGFPTSLLK